MTKIKICGLVCEEDIRLANEYEPDYAGFVVEVPKSRRNLSLPEAGALMDHLEPGIKRVAVTVSPDTVLMEKIKDYDFDFIQIHGKLTEKVYHASPLPILRAISAGDLTEYALWKDRDKVEGYVFDNWQPGSGKIFDWSVLEELDLDRDKKTVFLAGGINEENVERAIREVRPDVIDLSSAVEIENGGDRSCGKDPEKMSMMIRKVHNAE